MHNVLSSLGAVSWGLLENSPATGVVAVADEPSRKATIAGTELIKIWAAEPGMKDESISGVTRSLILTGQRVSEVCGTEVSELDFEAALWTRPAGRSKKRVGAHDPSDGRAAIHPSRRGA